MKKKKKKILESEQKRLIVSVYFLSCFSWLRKGVYWFPFQKNNTEEERNINKSKKTRKCYGEEEGGWKASRKRRNCHTWKGWIEVWTRGLFLQPVPTQRNERWVEYASIPPQYWKTQVAWVLTSCSWPWHTHTLHPYWWISPSFPVFAIYHQSFPSGNRILFV